MDKYQGMGKKLVSVEEKAISIVKDLENKNSQLDVASRKLDNYKKTLNQKIQLLSQL